MVTESTVSDWRSPRLSRIVHNVNVARKCDKFTDVTFVVGKDENACTIKAHRVVLCTASEELAKLVSDSNNLEKIRIPEVSPRGFKNLIRFLYDLDVTFSDLSTVRDIHDVAQKYKVDKLRQAAENYLNRGISYDSILKKLQTAIELNEPSLQSKCIDLILTKYQEILKLEELILAPFEVLSAVLSVRPCQGEACQYQALFAIGKWMKKRGTDPTKLEHLLSCVDFTRIGKEDFKVFIDENKGLLSNVDIEAFQKYIQTKRISDAPKWYRPSDKEKDDAKTEMDTLEKQFLRDMERQKLKLKETLDKEMRYIDKQLTEAADVSCDLFKSTVNETVQSIRDFIYDIVREAVETTVENFEDDLLFNIKKENEKANKEKESANAATAIASAPRIDELSVGECSSNEGSGVEAKNTDFIEVVGDSNVKMEKEKTFANEEKASSNATTEIASAPGIDKLIAKLSVSDEGSSIVQKSAESIEVAKDLIYLHWFSK